METDATPGNAPRARRGIPTARNVDHFGFTVPNLEEAIRFFVDVLGCELLYRAGPFEDEGDWMRSHLNAAPAATLNLAALRCGPTANVELLEFRTPKGKTQPPRTSDAGASHLAFYVEDLDAALAYVKEQPGVEVLGEPTPVEGQPSEGLRFVYFLTPWGCRWSWRTGPRACPTKRGPQRACTGRKRRERKNGKSKGGDPTARAARRMLEAESNER